MTNSVSSFSAYLMCLYLLCSIYSCKTEKQNTQVAFYHWKTTFQPSFFEKNYCQQLNTQKLYVKFFDIDWNETTDFPQPIGILEQADSVFGELIPVVFITNKTFLRLDDSQTDTLAKLVTQKVKAIAADKLSSKPFQELQIDCDWTATTRDRFFTFLKRLQNISGLKISVTIRLHQIKYKSKTGVPPVTEGVLMAYNMGDLDDLYTHNSILDLAVLNTYITHLKQYPLKLNIALPIYSWGVVSRDGEVVKLIHNLDRQHLIPPPQSSLPTSNNDIVFKEKSPVRFEVMKNTYLKGYYLYKDDDIRIENMADSPSTLQEAARLIAKNMQKPPSTIIFYHLDSMTLQRFKYEDLDAIIQSF